MVTSGYQDQTTRIWDVASGEELFRFRTAHRGREVWLSPDGSRVLTSEQAALQIRDARSGKILASAKLDPPGARAGVTRDWKRTGT